MHVLIVEDDEKTSAFIAKGLRQAGYAVDVAEDGEEGMDMLMADAYDAAVVDIMLPRLDGVSLVEIVRGSGNRTPIIFLSARHSVDDRVQGLRCGGDDYMVKPFAFVELLARLEAQIRRSTAPEAVRSLNVADLTLDFHRRLVSRGGQAIELQPREFALLEYLMRNKGRVVSKTMIMEHVWDYSFDPQTNVVEASICRLRTKIRDQAGAALIRTIRGVGYVLEDPS